LKCLGPPIRDNWWFPRRVASLSGNHGDIVPRIFCGNGFSRSDVLRGSADKDSVHHDAIPGTQVLNHEFMLCGNVRPKHNRSALDAYFAALAQIRERNNDVVGWVYLQDLVRCYGAYLHCNRVMPTVSCPRDFVLIIASTNKGFIIQNINFTFYFFRSSKKLRW
jgi:hypothetical protein